MSSGAYAIEIPLALFGLVISATESTMASLEQAKEARREIDRRIASKEAEFLRIQEATDAVLADIRQFRESLKTLNFHYSAETATFTAREEGISTEVESSLNLGDLMFLDVDVQTQEIVYVVLDYSDTISVRNAKNSAQFKKMALASDLMKKVMIWVVDDPQERKQLNLLIEAVNGMLDDNSVSFSHFQQFVEMRFSAFQRRQDTMAHDPALWDQYCALCAMRGEHPRRLHRAALEQEVHRLLGEAASAKYISAARATFMEAVAQLGLEVQSDYVLDQVSGSLLVDQENPGFNLFFSDHDHSFLLEMVETGESSPETRQEQHKNVCRKRRQLEEIMRSKGYKLRICAENDSACGLLTGTQEKKAYSESRAEQLRRRRSLAGKTAKLKMAGGKQ